MNKYQEALTYLGELKLLPDLMELRYRHGYEFLTLRELVNKATPIKPHVEEEFVVYGDDDCGTQVRYYCPICHREVYIGQCC